MKNNIKIFNSLLVFTYTTRNRDLHKINFLLDYSVLEIAQAITVLRQSFA